MAPLETMDGVPLWKPPYGRVTAIGLNTGDHRWMTPVGDLAEEIPALKQLGLNNLGSCAWTSPADEVAADRWDRKEVRSERTVLSKCRSLGGRSQPGRVRQSHG